MGKIYLFEIIVTCWVLLILYAVLRVVHVIWWRPNYWEKLLRRQGIRGTSYKLLRGDIVEIKASMMEAHSKPMSGLSHHITPRVFPFFHDLMQKYGYHPQFPSSIFKKFRDSPMEWKCSLCNFTPKIEL